MNNYFPLRLPKAYIFAKKVFFTVCIYSTFNLVSSVVGDSTARDGGKPGGKKSCELSHILGTSDTVPTDAQLDLMS